MKSLIISDTHLYSFHFGKFQFLKKIIEDCDQVILNGDFWDGYIVTFDEFIASAWNQLFPLLLKKNTIYLYGNHDKAALCTKETSRFSVESKAKHIMNIGAYEYIIEHGNRLCPFWDERITTFDPKLKYENFATDFLQYCMAKALPWPIRQRLYAPFNVRIKRQLKHILTPNQIYVCGHTHCAEFAPDKQFINGGFVKYGIAQYLVADENGLHPINARY